MTSRSDPARNDAHLRALGLRERCLYLYSQRNPLLFVLAAEFDIALDAHRVSDALCTVQCRHPLLSAHIKDDRKIGPAFYRTAPVAPIDLTVHRDFDQDWQLLAAEELTRPFDTVTAPLMRATLVTHGMTSTLLLTFDHVISDGISSILVLNDLLAALNGEPLATLPLPKPLEDLASRKFAASRIDIVSADVGDPRMAVPTSIRPFDATPPHVYRLAMDRDTTARLTERCREEQTTVHAAIVTAASRARGTRCGEEFVRTYSPINVRELVTQESGCCLCISFACTGTAPADGTAFWCQAREVNSQLKVMRSADGLMLGSAVLKQHLPADADCEAAESFLRTFVPFEHTITNMGVQNVPPRSVRPRAIWGPIIVTQIEREYVTGVVTYDGQLRMVTCGHMPAADFLGDVLEVLKYASRHQH
jgi:hypothetical protein